MFNYQVIKSNCKFLYPSLVYFLSGNWTHFFQIDHDSRAKDWCEALEEVIRFYYEDKHEVWTNPEQ